MKKGFIVIGMLALVLSGCSTSGGGSVKHPKY